MQSHCTVWSEGLGWTILKYIFIGISSIIALKSCYTFPGILTGFSLWVRADLQAMHKRWAGEKKRVCLDLVCLPEVTEQLNQTQQNQVQKTMFLQLSDVQGLSFVSPFWCGIHTKENTTVNLDFQPNKILIQFPISFQWAECLTPEVQTLTHMYTQLPALY